MRPLFLHPILSLAVAAPAALAQVTTTPIPNPAGDGFACTPQALNEAGTVLISCAKSVGGPAFALLTRNYLWSSSTRTARAIPPLRMAPVQAMHLNDRGQVTGAVLANDRSGRPVGTFVWSARGGYGRVVLEEGNWGAHINNRGEVLLDRGWITAEGVRLDFPAGWTNNGGRAGRLNNLSQMPATSTITFMPAVVDTAGQVAALPPSPSPLVPVAINDGGQAIFSWGVQGWRYSAGTYSPIAGNGPPPVTIARAEAINRRGQMAGWVQWMPGLPMQPAWWPTPDAPQVLPTSGAGEARAIAINGAGQVLGLDGQRMVLWQVPVAP